MCKISSSSHHTPSLFPQKDTQHTFRLAETEALGYCGFTTRTRLPCWLIDVIQWLNAILKGQATEMFFGCFIWILPVSRYISISFLFYHIWCVPVPLVWIKHNGWKDGFACTGVVHRNSVSLWQKVEVPVISAPSNKNQWSKVSESGQSSWALRCVICVICVKYQGKPMSCLFSFCHGTTFMKYYWKYDKQMCL